MDLESYRRALVSGDLAGVERAVATLGPAARMEEDPGELTALHLACAAGHVGIVELLLSERVGCDPAAARNNRFTPLHAAAMRGHAAVCTLLLARGAPVNAQTDPQGYAPLHSAAFAGHLQAIAALLAQGADPSLLNYRGERPADTARRQGQTQAAALLEPA